MKTTQLKVGYKVVDTLVYKMGSCNKDRNFNCSYCDKKFTRKFILVEHERIHTGDKPYSCSYCDHKFSRSSALKRHERIHNGDKPFSCSQCDYKCSTSSNLKQHEMIHTGEKPFSCSQCDYKCSRSANLKIHYSRIHSSDRKLTQLSNLKNQEKGQNNSAPFSFLKEIKEEPSSFD